MMRERGGCGEKAMAEQARERRETVNAENRGADFETGHRMELLRTMMREVDRMRLESMTKRDIRGGDWEMK